MNDGNEPVGIRGRTSWAVEQQRHLTANLVYFYWQLAPPRQLSPCAAACTGTGHLCPVRSCAARSPGRRPASGWSASARPHSAAFYSWWAVLGFRSVSMTGAAGERQQLVPARWIRSGPPASSSGAPGPVPNHRIITEMRYFYRRLSHDMAGGQPVMAIGVAAKK